MSTAFAFLLVSCSVPGCLLCVVLFGLTVAKDKPVSDKVGTGISCLVSVLCIMLCAYIVWLYFVGHNTRDFEHFLSTTFLFLTIIYVVLSAVLPPLSSVLHYMGKALPAWIIKFIPLAYGAILPWVYDAVASYMGSTC